MNFVVGFSGHENIRSNHQKTIEITKERSLTPSGDCIVGVNATFACSDLPALLKKELRNTDCKMTLTFLVGPHEFIVSGRGHPELTLDHDKDIVIRKSDFVCPRTIAVSCDKSSDMLPRKMVRLLQDPSTRGTMIINTWQE